MHLPTTIRQGIKHTTYLNEVRLRKTPLLWHLTEPTLGNWSPLIYIYIYINKTGCWSLSEDILLVISKDGAISWSLHMRKAITIRQHQAGSNQRYHQDNHICVITKLFKQALLSSLFQQRSYYNTCSKQRLLIRLLMLI